MWYPECSTWWTGCRAPVYPGDMSLAFGSCSLTAMKTICTPSVSTLSRIGVYAMLKGKNA